MEAINISKYFLGRYNKSIYEGAKIKFKVSKQDVKPYNPEFVKKIKQGNEDLKNGKTRTVTLVELDSL